MSLFFDEIVVGAGAVGSATAYHLVKIRHQQNKPGKTLVLDQFKPLHMYGSSGGETRATRTAITQGSNYVALVKRAQELWQEIEKIKGYTPGSLYHPVGNLYIISQQKEADTSESNYFFKAMQVAKEFGLPMKRLSNEEIKKFYPQYTLKSDEVIYEEESAGYLLTDICINSQIELAKKYGAIFNNYEKMLTFEESKDGMIKVVTDKAEYITGSLILTMGPWVKNLIKKYSTLFTIHRKVFYWFEIEPSSIQHYQPQSFPVFYWDFNNQDYMYGFPIISHNSIKIATSKSEVIDDPDHIDRTVSEREIAEVYQSYIKPRFKGVTSKCIKTLVCLYTMAPQELFIIDYLPGYHEKVILASPCSGRGFKYSSAVGEGLAQLALHGKSDINLFALTGHALS